jgi:hypothetical protein
MADSRSLLHNDVRLGHALLDAIVQLKNEFALNNDAWKEQGE